MAVAAANLLYYLPDECWEDVFKFLTCYDDRDMDSLSVVSKQFLTITNRLDTLSLSVLKFVIAYPSSFKGDLDDLLLQISQFPLKLTSLTFSYTCTIPMNGLRAFSQKITTLKSLTFYYIADSFTSTDIFFIADCFPLLEELDLSYPYPSFTRGSINPSIVEPLSLALFKLRKVNLSCHNYINDNLLLHLFKNCKLLEEANLSQCYKLTNAGIASALLERPTLKSLTFHVLQDWAMLSAFTRNCPSLSEITVRARYPITVDDVENLNSFVVCPQLRSLSFDSGCCLTEETVKVLALFPNLVRLKLTLSKGGVGMCQLLRMCCKLRHLNLSHGSMWNVSKMNFEVPKLEVLNLTNTSVVDNALYAISKSCCGLLKLILEHCLNVTERGVKYVVKNCIQLRVINLRNCDKVDADVAASILLSRPSLIKIIAPPRKK